MKKQSIVIAFYCSTLIFTLIYAEPQLSYWQQFKNWISGGASYAQSTAGASYEWAQNFVAGLTPVQKEMLKGALIGFGMTGGIASIKSGKTSAHGALTAAGGGALMMGILAEQPKANQIASGQ